MPTRELEALRETGMQTPESLQTAEMVDLRLEKESHFNDFVAVKDTWHEELAHAAKEKDAMRASVKEAQAKKYKKLKQQTRELQMRRESLEMELCRKEWSHSACLREKDVLTRKYKNQLSLAAEREWILKQSKTQAELDWQQLCEKAESNWCQKSEDLTQSPSSTTDHVEADLQKTDYRLHEVKTVLSALTVEREQTIQASFNHNILPEEDKQVLQYDDRSSLSKDTPCLEIKKLQEQNANLRAAIAQMRKEMESLDEQMLPSLPLSENRQLAQKGDTLAAELTGTTCESYLTHEKVKLITLKKSETAEDVIAQYVKDLPLLGFNSVQEKPYPLSADKCSLYTNKISTGTTLSNTKVSSTNLDCIVKPNVEKGPKPKVLEDKMLDLGQQLPDIGPGVGLQYGVNCTIQGMQNKLKEAARKISILSQDKQQLTEMGNRLRAELRMVLKEGLCHPVSSKRCTVCIASGSLFPRELVKRTQCQLSALKHLQHRLTTQELQYTNQQHPSQICSLIACPSLKEEEAPSSSGEETELLSAEVQLDFCTENHGPEQRKADTPLKIVQSQPLRQSPSQAQQVQLSLSRAHNFCQGVWQTLEMGSSPSILSPQKNTDQVESEVVRSTEQSEESQQNIKAKDKLEMPAACLTVRGTRLEVQQKLKSRNLSCAHPIKPKISCNMAKIRNYNIKD